MLKILEKIHSHQPIDCADTLVLPFELRCKGRFRAVTVNGQEVGLFLERGQVLSNHDVLVAENGEHIAVQAAAEAVVTAHCEHWQDFSRLCYHLGNRHVPLQIGERWLRFQPDHVLEDLARHHGATVQAGQAAFMPENGAYGQHSHSHSRSHSHSHAHSPSHSHSHSHSHSDESTHEQAH